MDYSEILAKRWPNGRSSVESMAHSGDQQGLRWPGLYPPAFLGDQMWATVGRASPQKRQPCSWADREGAGSQRLSAGHCVLRGASGFSLKGIWVAHLCIYQIQSKNLNIYNSLHVPHTLSPHYLSDLTPLPVGHRLFTRRAPTLGILFLCFPGFLREDLLFCLLHIVAEILHS